MIFPVILCGGSGTRLWPLSRSSAPKQFLSLLDSETLFDKSLDRAVSFAQSNSKVLIVTNVSLLKKTEESVNKRNLHNVNYLIEPTPKNTGPAIAAAAYAAYSYDKEAVLVVLPSDHYICSNEDFHADIFRACELAQKKYFITLGIKPQFPETGFGYIECGEHIESKCYLVKSFVEKPSKTTAEEFFKSKKWLWNAGIFIFRADLFIQELNEQAPEIAKFTQASLNNAAFTANQILLDKSSFEKNPSISIDYALMEKTKKIAVIPYEKEWHDLGSWQEIYAVCNKDKKLNVLKGNVYIRDSSNCYIHSNHRLVATIGLKNLAIIETKDAVLITALDKSQDVKEIVSELKAENIQETFDMPEISRPWGFYESIALGERFQVKKINVLPGEELSMQKHFHRSEHWIVVQGIAEVIVDNQTKMLKEDECIYIPSGSVHKLKNPGKIPLTLIEVQSGSYLGEDDIIRISDKYNRVKHDV